MRRLLALIVTAAAGAISTPAPADILTLDTGYHLWVESWEVQGNEVVLRFNGGEARLPRAHVVGIRRQTPEEKALTRAARERARLQRDLQALEKTLAREEEALAPRPTATNGAPGPAERIERLREEIQDLKEALGEAPPPSDEATK